ncbi:MAG: M15 family metallopeptidase, partial [Firmicutes bacterium]|nr:M15 family metallopeptidase [Bacillota bacterium]
PNDLLDIAKLAPSTKGVMQLRDAAANAYIRMYTAYKEEKNLTLNTISGFRNYNVQKQLFNGKVAKRQHAGQSYKTAYNNTLLYTALPGTSEHQTGLAIDLSNNTGLSDNFRNTEQGQWLLTNCWNYG